MENYGMTFECTEIDRFLPGLMKEEQIKILKERYDLDFEFYPGENFDGTPRWCETHDAYLGCVYPKDQGYKLDQMMIDMGYSIH